MDNKHDVPPTYEEATNANFNTAYSAPVGDLDGHQFAQPHEVYALGQTAPQRAPPYQFSQAHDVVTQPNFATPQTATVPDYMNMAILATICCFWPLGIVAMMRSNEVRDALARNDIPRAMASARASKRVSCYAVCIGVVMWISIPVIVVLTLVTD